MLNPETSTCIRLAPSGYSWDDAKANCEAKGEKLAVFTTEESLAWIRDYVRNRAPAGIHYEANYPFPSFSSIVLLLTIDSMRNILFVQMTKVLHLSR